MLAIYNKWVYNNRIFLEEFFLIQSTNCKRQKVKKTEKRYCFSVFFTFFSKSEEKRNSFRRSLSV